MAPSKTPRAKQPGSRGRHRPGWPKRLLVMANRPRSLRRDAAVAYVTCVPSAVAVLTMLGSQILH
eukprot:13472726-Alexandrium_andersonii.AAC.1